MAFSDFTASSIYGGAPSVQPTATPNQDHAVGEPEPMARTTQRGPAGLGNPTVLLIILIGIAAFLINFSVRIDVSG